MKTKKELLERKNDFKMNIQLFSDSEGEENKDDEENLDDTENKDNEENKDDTENKPTDLVELLKDENFKKQYQASVDRTVTKALETREKKFQEEKAEAERKSKLTAEELQIEKIREIEEKEKEIKEYEIKLQKIEFFKEKGLSLDLVDYIQVNTKEEIEEKTAALMEYVNKEVENKVKERLKENGYNIPTDPDKKGAFSMKDLEGLTVEEINKVWDKIQ